MSVSAGVFGTTPLGSANEMALADVSGIPVRKFRACSVIPMGVMKALV